MDVKDLTTESALSERNNDGSKYSHGGVALQCNRNKSYQDIGSNPLAKAEPTPVRPCAVIGPDRVVPPPASSDAFLKKGLVEPWPSPDNVYRRPPEYPHKISNNHPSRNISPRQTFQENMQRIMVPPSYNAVRHSDDANFNHIQDRNVALSKNVKPNMAQEVKYCDVPYAINTLTSEPKNVRDSEMYVPSVNSPLTRTAPHAWPPASVNALAPRSYGAHELYQYPHYPSCAGQRPVVIPMTRAHRTIDDPAFVYPEHYYQDASARFKSYQPVKERFPQPRYEYIGNYPSQFHPPPPPQTHKYDISKPGQPHPYSIYPHLKYVDNRVPEHAMEGYQRPTNQQPHYNIQFRNQLFHPTYAPGPGSSSQNKLHPYPPDGPIKPAGSNKLHYDTGSKMYIDYENARNKTFPSTESYFINEIGRVHSVKNQMPIANYPSVGMHPVPSQQYFRKDNSQIKPFEYMPHYRNFDPSLNAMMRHAPQFSPNTLAISPTDSTTSNDISQIHGTSQEDCGYVSQSSTASVRSMDSGAYRHPHEYYKKYDFRYGPIVGSSPTLSKSDLNSNNVNSKDKQQQQINVRQFLQMWNEGDEENGENNNSNEIVIQTGSSDIRHFSKQHESNQDQLYVLGLVNVPSEELGKYEHIQKISKLPENIKGYNNLELLSQFEEAIESSKAPVFKSIPKEYQVPLKDNLPKQLVDSLPRPVSPLDVEAKISQSVIHKEVGCNFEIRPCSPKMLNVEVAAPALNVLGERVIEKVSNPLSKIIKSPKPINSDDKSNCQTTKGQENIFAINDNPSCKMVRSPYVNHMDSIKTNYSLQDLEINSGVCLASLPRLDNEIEFNFPEVNQQFINANKKDTNSAIRHYVGRNNLESESGLSNSTSVNKDMEKSENGLMVEEPEKTFSKLSKYRKLKVHSPDQSGKNQKTKVIRTDSVIIKNPENIKNIEDKLLENSLNVPINLSSQSTVCHVAPNKVESRDSVLDIALDFSLNKSGNDLPIIDIAQHISCENNEPSGSSKSYTENTNYHETIISNLKHTIDECMETETNEGTCVENSEVNKDIEDHLNEDIINPTVMNENIHTSVLCDSFSDNSILQNTLPSDKHMYVNNDADHINYNEEISESSQASKDIERVNVEEQNNECNTNKDAITSNDNVENEERAPQNLTSFGNLVVPHTNVSKCEESGEIMDLLTPENEVNNFIDRNELLKKQELVVSSQNNIDFENDEISATLEKIFQENTEDTSFLNSDNTSTETTISLPVKTICCYKSKELHSPWIQKLLTNSEGLCSNNENEKVQDKVTNSILITDEYNNITKHNNIHELKKEHSNMDIDHNDGTKDWSANEKFGNISAAETRQDDLNKFESSIKSSQLDITADTVNDISMCYSNNETQELIKTLTDTEDTNFSNEQRPKEFIAKEDCKMNSEFDIKTRNGLEENVLNILEDSKCSEERSNSETVMLRVESKDNKTKTAHYVNTAAKTSDALETKDNVSKPVNIIENRLSSSEFLKFDSTDFIKQENPVTENTVENIIIKNVVNTDVACEFDNNDQESVNELSCESLSKSITNCVGLLKEEKRNSDSLIENLIVNSDAVTNETLGDSSIGCKVDNTFQKVPKSDNIESLTDNLDEQGIEENHSSDSLGEKLLQNSDISETTESFISSQIDCELDNKGSEDPSNSNVESLSITVIDNFLENQSGADQTGEVLSENVENRCVSSAGETSEILDSCHIDRKFNNIVNDDSNTPCFISISNHVLDNCSQRQDESQSRKTVVEKVIKNREHSTGEFSNTFGSSSLEHDSQKVCLDDLSNSILNRPSNSVSEDSDEKKSESKIDPINNCIGVAVESGLSDTSKNYRHVPDVQIQDVKSHSVLEQVPDSHHGPDIQIQDVKSHSVLEQVPDCHHVPDVQIQDVKSHSVLEQVPDCHHVPDVQIQDVKSHSVLEHVPDCHHGPDIQIQDVKSHSVLEQVPDCHHVPDVQIQDVKSHSVLEQEPDCHHGPDVQIQDVKSHSMLEQELDYHHGPDVQIQDVKSHSVLEQELDYHHGPDVQVQDVKSQSVLEQVLDCHHGPDVQIQDVKSHSVLEQEPDCHHGPDVQIQDVKSHSVLEQEPDCHHGPDVQVQDVKSHSVLEQVLDCHHGPDVQIQDVESHSVLGQEPDCISEKRAENEIEENETNIIEEDKVLLPLVCNGDEDESICYQVVEDDQVQLENYALPSDIHEASANRRPRLKRSLSDSALNNYKNRDATDRQEIENSVLIWPPKRQRLNEFESSEQHVINENICNFIQNTRRNSVSSFYNEENVSFCILIDDNCIITEENEEEKICFADISQDCITEVNTTNDEEDNNIDEIVYGSSVDQLDFGESVILNYENEKPIQETWLDDVACVETVVSDDILEDEINNARVSPKYVEVSDIYNCDMSKETDDVDYINEETIIGNISEEVDTHRSPHIGVNEVLYDKEHQDTELCHAVYENDYLEKSPSQCNSPEYSPTPTLDYKDLVLTDDSTNIKTPEGKENIFVADMSLQNVENHSNYNSDNKDNYKKEFSEDTNQTETSCSSQDYDVHSYESSIDREYSYKGQDNEISYTSSSSPEVSSTTSEEKSSCILLKITNYNGSRVSEVNEINRNRPRCKFTEEKEYSNSHGVFPKRPLITKAAQKYIPPLNETIRDLKVKLSLPQQKLLKLKQLKLSRSVPKVKTQSSSLTTSKKPKPNFEDVLKNIDKVQIKMHKEKSKKSKNIVPKVVIKKNLFGSHYTSLSNKDTFNPDLTGRKWQPWVFLEKNHFIDKMAISHNTKAIYSHRKNSYVLAEKFKKYKSVSNCSAKFVISHPKSGDTSKGQLKYTIRLKHTY